MAAGDVALSFLDALERGDMTDLRALMTDDFAFVGLAPQPLDANAFLALESGFHAAFEEVSYAPRLLAEDDETAEVAIVVSGRLTGTWELPDRDVAPTGRRFELPEQRPRYTIRDGRVARAEMPAVAGAGVDAILAQVTAD